MMILLSFTLLGLSARAVMVGASDAAVWGPLTCSIVLALAWAQEYQNLTACGF